MSEKRPDLLFVCVESSNRSQMAEGLARRLGQGRVTVFSAGSHRFGQIDPRAIQFTKEKGIDLMVRLSKGLDDLPKVHWDCVVTMGCDDACPMLPVLHRLDWDLPDPKHLDDAGFRVVRNRIDGLAGDLVAEATRPAPIQEERHG